MSCSIVGNLSEHRQDERVDLATRRDVLQSAMQSLTRGNENLDYFE